MSDEPLHIVAVGAHPDDVELSMAGLLIRFAQAGHVVTWIVATDGAAGQGGRDPLLAAQRMAEAAAGAREAGAAIVTLGFPDGRLAWVAEAPALIGAELERLKPDLIVTHALNDYHADHRAAARLVCDTSPIGVPILHADTMLGVHFLPDLLVDISGVYQAKLAALAQHASQSTLALAEALETWSRFRGLQSNASGYRYAEAYAINRRLGGEARLLLDRIGGYKFV